MGHNQNLSSIQTDKAQARLLLKKQIMALSTQDRQQKSLQVTELLQKHLQGKKGKWGAFTPMPSEPQVDWQKANAQIEWCFVHTEDNGLKFINNNKSYSVQELDGICVPGLGFHLNGARLGRGGGYYDRELQNFNKHKIGIAFDLAVSAELPFEAHDVKVNVIITDQRMVQAA